MTKQVFYADPPRCCDMCNWTIDKSFIDGKTRQGPWGNMCPTCWSKHGVGRLGIGFGQRYVKQDDGRFLKVEG